MLAVSVQRATATLGDTEVLAVASEIRVEGSVSTDHAHVLSDEALAFVADLQGAFGKRRAELLAARMERRASLVASGSLDFLADTADVRDGDWRVAPAPPDLRDRRVEITGPAERKMLINALNCGARVFMADLEDALSPTWTNVVGGQADLLRAVTRAARLHQPGRQALFA